jgi:CO/xanthine dehydrogenase FAD-binding subunit
MVGIDGAGRCTNARVAVGSVSWKPIVLDLEALRGRKIDMATAREAARPVHALAEPMSDVRGSAAYKREMAVEYAARALMTAWQRATA